MSGVPAAAVAHLAAVGGAEQAVPPATGADAPPVTSWGMNELGLLAEEVDPATGGPLGNFPQAFSHIGLVNAARAIARAEKDRPASTLDMP